MSENLNLLQGWIGRSQTVDDTVRLEPARFMEQTLDRTPQLQLGDPLPHLWHWLYALQSDQISQLGRDGHPEKGGFLPPVSLPRRMWAGGKLTFHKPLVLGQPVRRISTIRAIDPKQGRSGRLCFIKVHHAFGAPGDVPAIEEEQDIVFREDPRPDAPVPQAPELSGAWPEECSFQASPIVLFRYSALTFNGHRIHYDRDYAKDVEGHGGLVVHGPLIATLLADFACQAAKGETLSGFSFRATAPVFDDTPLRLLARRSSTGTEAVAALPDGRLAMTAQAKF